MYGSGQTTVPSLAADPLPVRREARSVFGLVYLFHKHQPRRVGEVGLLDPAIASTWVYGRDTSLAEVAGKAKLRFGKQMPGAFFAGGPVVGENVSRSQLEIRVGGGDLELTLVGKEAAFLNGAVLERGKRTTLRLGDVVHIRQHATLLVVTRPDAMMDLHGDEDAWPHHFGEADPHGIVGESDAAWELRRDLSRAARAGGSVLLLGPSGSGKERAAEALHRLARRPGPFVAVNAAALPEGVLEAELFGNIRNYPNAGTPERPGYVGAAHGGTLFLDEIARMSKDGQAALLRLLQEGRYNRLGEASARSADVFVVAATNEDTSRLRFDALMRFGNVVNLAALAARREDIVPIARDFVLQLARTRPGLASQFVVEISGRSEVDWTPAMVHAMVSAPWNGNVRELQSFVRGALARNKERPIHPPADMSPWGVRPSPAPPFPGGVAEERVGVDGESARSAARSTPDEAVHVRAALAKCRGNVTQAAALLGLNRRAMYRLMEKVGVSRD